MGNSNMQIMHGIVNSSIQASWLKGKYSERGAGAEVRLVDVISGQVSNTRMQKSCAFH